VLKAQLDKYADLQNNVEFLSTYSSYSQNVDFAGRMIYNENGEEIFNFGKHKGKKVVDVIGKLEPQYYDWIMKNDFALNTKQVLTQIKLRIAQDRMNGGR
ncbi:MAG: 3'-5' exonuclease, partial [Bacteroidales bacterium]|nr:3'-5' exonuclease [Bacteroidales bacterium]